MSPAQNAILTIQACLGNAFPERLEIAAFAAEAIERARVVGALDAWADKHGLDSPVVQTSPGVGFRCFLSRTDPCWGYPGATRDAARAAAAKAIESGEV